LNRLLSSYATAQY